MEVKCPRYVHFQEESQYDHTDPITGPRKQVLRDDTSVRIPNKCSETLSGRPGASQIQEQDSIEALDQRGQRSCSEISEERESEFRVHQAILGADSRVVIVSAKGDTGSKEHKIFRSVEGDMSLFELSVYPIIDTADDEPLRIPPKASSSREA